MRLSKTDYVAGMQCPDLLWYRKNAYDELPEPSEADRAIMEQGGAVGRLATELYGGGIQARGKSEDAAVLTQRLLERDIPVFEATFLTKHLLCKVDVLEPSGDGYNIVEVKSSTRVKDEHLLDVAFQLHTLERAGIDVHDAYLLHIDTNYVRDGPLDLEQLFIAEDVTDQLLPILEDIQDDIDRLLEIASGERPELRGPHHCDNRYCPLPDMVKLPEHNVTELYYNTGQKYAEQGVVKITDIADGAGLNKKQRIQWETIKNGEPHAEQDKIRGWLDTITYPAHLLDFETINPALPRYDNTSPYQHMPFQFSCHVLHEGGSTEHYEYLHGEDTDPRAALIDAMRPLKEASCIVAHNASFERRILNQLHQYSGEDWLQAATEKLVDTITPFRNFWYHHPAQRGSCGLKAIVPLTSNSYDDLEIQGGDVAQLAYQRMIDDADGADEIYEQLLAYCRKDTEAMISVLRLLEDAAS